jgi:hypothetical protein
MISGFMGKPLYKRDVGRSMSALVLTILFHDGNS